MAAPKFKSVGVRQYAVATWNGSGTAPSGTPITFTSPTMPPGIRAGDFLLIVAISQTTNYAAPNYTANWTPSGGISLIDSSGKHAYYGGTWDGVTVPTLTPSRMLSTSEWTQVLPAAWRPAGAVYASNTSSVQFSGNTGFIPPNYSFSAAPGSLAGGVSIEVGLSTELSTSVGAAINLHGYTERVRSAPATPTYVDDTRNYSSSNSVTVTLPTCAVGDTMCAVVWSVGGTTWTGPSGWTNLYASTAADLAGLSHGVWYRVRDGSEGSSITVSVTSGADTQAHVIAVHDVVGAPQAAYYNNSNAAATTDVAKYTNRISGSPWGSVSATGRTQLDFFTFCRNGTTGSNTASPAVLRNLYGNVELTRGTRTLATIFDLQVVGSGEVKYWANYEWSDGLRYWSYRGVIFPGGLEAGIVMADQPTTGSTTSWAEWVSNSLSNHDGAAMINLGPGPDPTGWHVGRIAW